MTIVRRCKSRRVCWILRVDGLIRNLTIAVEVVETVTIGIMRHGELLIVKEGVVILTASWRIVGHA